MTIKVDLEKLGTASKTLHKLSGEAADLDALQAVPIQVLLPFGGNSTLESVVASSLMALDVQTSLVPAVSRRLSEIGDLMHAVTVQFQKAEEASTVTLAATFTKSSGDWQKPK
ncbi:hypothetical protein ACFYV7_13190 [Nocardia suismassiliense]|uniref:Uncharacterized protein n=1 Tax=Nocardia suismassiliense TaxID=2077092 RepID=A0ABW6QR94_9NOCA|nr:hypothetical protein [Nocardia sp. XZ_19_369]